MPEEFWARTIGAMCAIAFGTLVIVFRVGISSWMADTQRAFLGKAGLAAAKNSTPMRTAFVGVGGILIGLIVFGEGLATLI